jgi:hypothetical protein
MKPVVTWNAKKPNIHRTRSTTAIVQSIFKSSVSEHDRIPREPRRHEVGARPPEEHDACHCIAGGIGAHVALSERASMRARGTLTIVRAMR